MPATPADSTSAPASRIVAALVGGAASVSVATLGYALGWELVALAGALGVPAAIALGLMFGPRSVQTDSPATFALFLATLSPVVGLAIAGGALAVMGVVDAGWSGGAPPADPASIALGIPVAMAWLAVIGFGGTLVGIPIAVPTALFAVAVVRALMSRGSRKAIAGGFVLAVAAALPAAGVAMDWRQPTPHESPWEAGLHEDTPFGRYPLRLLIVNRSMSDGMVSVWTPDAHGTTGSAGGFGACGVTAATYAVGDGWWVALGEDVEGMPDEVARLVDAGARPGTEPTAVIEVASDGTARLRSELVAPLPGPLPLAACVD